MKFKKLALSLGSIAAIAAPVTAVVSCGGTSSAQYSESDLLKMSNLKSTEAHSKLQDLWLATVLQSEYKMKETNSLNILKNILNTDSNDASLNFKEDFKATLTWVLKDKLFASKDALSSIYQSLKSNAPDSLIGDSNGVELPYITKFNTKVFDRSEISNAVDDIIVDGSWENIFYNYTETKDDGITFNPSILGVKDLVLKMMITKKYLSLSAADYNKALPDENSKLDSKFRDTTLIKPDEANFPLVVSVMNSRLAYKTSIELAANKSKQFIVANIDNNLKTNEIADVFKYDSSVNPVGAGTSKFSDALTYSIRHQTRVDNILAKVPVYGPSENETVGFQGISSLPSGDDDLNTNTVSSIKLTKDSNARDGFIVDDKLIKIAKAPAAQDTIRFTDKDKTKVEVNYYTSLMPTYDTTKKTLAWDTSVDIDKLMNEAYSKDSSLYSSAVKYYTSKAKGHTPILIEVTNDWARNYYVNEGITYIKEDEK